MNETKSFQRIYGIDVIKLIILFPIVYFHLNEFVFGTNQFPLGDSAIFYNTIYPFTSFFAFSGVALVFLSFFLFGYKKSNTAAIAKLVPIFFLGQFLFNKIFNTTSSWYSFEWDIYSYLGASILFLVLINKIGNITARGVALASLFIIPFQELVASTVAQNPLLFAYCENNSVITWPLIPWIGLPALGYLLGEFSRDKDTATLGHKELIGWLIVLAGCAPFLGAYQGAPVGDDLYCFVFGRSKIDLLAHMLVIFFLIRLSLVESINSALSKNKTILFITRTMWVKKLWLCYIVHGVILGIASGFTSLFFKRPELFDSFFIIIIPLTDLICRLLLMLKVKTLS
ncbi:MAG: hypothetical protein KC478_08725 [Bacteriovoracaceae bacterium]|nr:hypothetical protein [Bacteriovoracaceae bacterium]